MIEIKIKDEWMEKSKKKAEEMGRLKHSILKGKGNITGFLGEYMVADYLKAKIENTYDYDIVKCDIKIDVKSKKCSSIPQPCYDCSVPAYNTKQKCDYYIFTRILNDFKKGWILGIISKEKFFKNARLYKKGEVDKSNGLRFKEDSYNIKIKDLVELKL
jgi:hypothetical protein